MRILVDTNVLLRAIDRSQPASESARNAFKELHAEGSERCLTPQNVREFWSVCTRPAAARGGLGLSTMATDRHLRMLERFFTVLLDAPETYKLWRVLILQHRVAGAKVHDAYLAAAMLAHDVTAILTFNTADFAPYEAIRIFDPMHLAYRWLQRVK